MWWAVAWACFAASGAVSGWLILYAWLAWCDKRWRRKDMWQGCVWCWRPRLTGHDECIEHVSDMRQRSVMPRQRAGAD